MPPKATEAAQEIQDILAQQQGLIARASQLKTAQEREDVFQAVARNVQAIAQKRVVVLEQYTQRARARVEWARKHASEVRVSDLTGAMQEFGAQGPRFPFSDDPNTPQRADSTRARLPDKVLDARSELQQTVNRLESLARECRQARTEEQRKKIEREINEHLQSIQKQRIAILESILEISEQRLADSRDSRQRFGGDHRD
jgi:DNA-binding ferritin-like protein (Dps family)